MFDMTIIISEFAAIIAAETVMQFFVNKELIGLIRTLVAHKTQKLGAKLGLSSGTPEELKKEVIGLDE